MDVHALVDFALRIPLEWLIRALVLVSMLLQLLLVVCGGRRHRSSSRILQFVVWLAYISADAVATSALGTMMHYARNEIYGIWAPLLLVHLGGPDAITAYSTADNELWLRHGFILIYQVLVASYVIYVSAFEGYLLFAAILVQIAGFIKYVERTVALAFASHSQIVSSTQPLDVLMKHEDQIAQAVCSEEEEEEYIYPLMGEQHLYCELKGERVNYERETWTRLLQKKGVVTIKDVWKHEGQKPTDDFMLCLSYALFKMYKRRFVSLPFHEGDREKTRSIFLNYKLLYGEVFRMVEMELKFMYDFLFSKSSLTAFSRYGAFRRFLSASSLAIAGFLIYNGIEVNVFKRTQRIVMYVLLFVAFVMEVYQLCRIIVSDWAMVWLICTKIQHLRESRVHPCILKTIETAMFLLQKARKLRGDRYWKNGIQQYSVIDTWFKPRYSCIWKLPKFILLFYIKNKHVEMEPVSDELKKFIFVKLQDLCSPGEEIETCKANVYAYHQCLFERECAEHLLWVSKLELVEVIVVLHVATTECEQERQGNKDWNRPLSCTLSRYCAYLLLSHPNLLPLHPDTSTTAYMKLHEEVVEAYKQNPMKLETNNVESSLGKGLKLAGELQEITSEKEMWELLDEYWAALLLYIAVYNKAVFHAQCLKSGGQFLTQLWVLLGHMGCGEQSDSAVTMRVEVKNPEGGKRKRKRKAPKENEEHDSIKEDMKKENGRRKDENQVTGQKLGRSRLHERLFESTLDD